MTRGYWYIIYGPDRYMEEAACSIESLLEVDPGANVSILIDQKPTSKLSELVDYVEIDKKLAPKSLGEGLVDGKFEGKLYNLHRSPYDYTFCVDTDTYFYEDCSRLFSLCQWFDLAVCQSEGERTVYWPRRPHTRMEGFTVWTNGVMIYRKSVVMLDVFKQAARDYRQNRGLYKTKGTNTHFSAAVAETNNIKVYTLPINYNARVRSKIALVGSVKIAHSSSGKRKMNKKDYEKVRRSINSKLDYRVWEP